MKKLLGILVLGLLLSSNAYAATRDYQELAKKELENCTKNGKWICRESKVLDLIEKFKKHGGFMDDCFEVNYRAPCTCEWAEGIVKRKYCEFKIKPAKLTRMKAADYCSDLSDRKNKEVREEYFKSCMKDQGY